MKKIMDKVNEGTIRLYIQGRMGKEKLIAVLSDQRGAGESDSTSAAVKILTSVVLGGLVLAGLYALFSGTVLPNLKSRIESMFNYGG
ncbi:DUF6133 family protein [Desulfitobacterium chlororespirans]|uniref:Uncharacterized protein n=1 Tax=Desulfitobacterium chlororespirans DSM 11544 TaxID=1121395 RepID=A0A1M7UYD9_9FIRM|nr:DUF6133 family protein [Desulfitobacterium chlororespirans]SHN87936.1 hypothetical protein SAMN02745215_05038 [Desulfitobacterium chlororespirans DSM 11544]